MAEWHEDDRFWLDVRSRIFGPAMRGSATEEATNIVRLLGIEPLAHILDLPCGVGRHSIELAKLGFRVTGVDRTPSYLEEAAACAAREGVSDRTSWLQGDMRDYRHDAAPGFDAAINVYTSFGYFENPADDRRTAETLFANLRSEGRVLFEMVNKDWIQKRFQASDWHEESDGTLVLEQRFLSADGSWIDNRWLTIRGSDRREIRFGHRLYGATELGALLRKVGFTALQTYGALSGVPATPDSPRLVVVAAKP